MINFLRSALHRVTGRRDRTVTPPPSEEQPNRGCCEQCDHYVVIRSTGTCFNKLLPGDGDQVAIKARIVDPRDSCPDWQPVDPDRMDVRLRLV